jgi:hypothetical protein
MNVKITIDDARTTREQLIDALRASSNVDTRDERTTQYIASIVEHACDLTRALCVAHIDARAFAINNDAHAYTIAREIVANIDVNAIVLRIVDDIDFNNIDVQS